MATRLLGDTVAAPERLGGNGRDFLLRVTQAADPAALQARVTEEIAEAGRAAEAALARMASDGAGDGEGRHDAAD